MPGSSNNLTNRLHKGVIRVTQNQRIKKLSRNVAGKSRPASGKKPVVFFNASTRLGGMSQNAAFSVLVSWSLQLAGTPVIHFVCNSGMSRCVLGTNPDDFDQLPPCQSCISQSNRLYASAPTKKFRFTPEMVLLSTMEKLSLSELFRLEYALQPAGKLIPLGKIILPSLRWALRRHNIEDNESTRKISKEFILSAFSVASEFSQFLQETEPSAVVIFNGLQYPEAIVKWVAEQNKICVITHEVGFQPYSAFFSEKEATAYPIDIPKEFQLSVEQNLRLDKYLSKRFRGDFTMAGIEFWPAFQEMDKATLNRISKFKNIVTVFTNVIFDTSQVHANKLFADMFAWLDALLDLIQRFPETMFIVRAHPDEKRPGTRKQSRESVSDWFANNELINIPNLIFYDSLEYINSYDLIRKSKFIMVYNSSIGLEAVLLGVPVLSAGHARYTQYPIVEIPESVDEYRKRVEELLLSETIEVPAEYEINARRFLFYQLFRVSIPFDEFISIHPTPGYVQLKRFNWHDLDVRKNRSLRVIYDGIIQNKPFVIQDGNL